MSNADPLRIRQAEFDAALDRLEAAVTGYNPGYGPVEHQADIAITHRFMVIWDGLPHHVQQAYWARIKRLQRHGKGQTT
jgi:hypothetical protein